MPIRIGGATLTDRRSENLAGVSKKLTGEGNCTGGGFILVKEGGQFMVVGSDAGKPHTRGACSGRRHEGPSRIISFAV
jgi:hypothetical protein